MNKLFADAKPRIPLWAAKACVAILALILIANGVIVVSSALQQRNFGPAAVLSALLLLALVMLVRGWRQLGRIYGGNH